MDNIEKRLIKEKERLDAITTPENVETRLRNALELAPTKKKRRVTPRWIVAAAVVFFLVIASYNYNAVAFYGKTLLGFDELISGTLKNLNEKGMGQPIDQKIKIDEETDVWLHGMMSDENRFILYYTLTNPSGINLFEEDLFRPNTITGTFTNAAVESGIYLLEENDTVLKATLSFEPVSPFAKELTLHYDQPVANGERREGTVTFPYNANQALPTNIKKSIKKKIHVDQGTVTFRSITATPTMTIIDGSLNVKNFDRVNLPLDGIELIANGEPVEKIGGGNSSAFLGRKFDIRFDALPEPLHSLELVVKEFVGYEKINKRITLGAPQEEPFLLYDNKKLWITNVNETNEGVQITLATDDDVMLDGVSIETANNEQIPLHTTVNQVSITKNNQTLKERTLLFETTLEPKSIIVEGIHYMKEYGDRIEIIANK